MTQPSPEDRGLMWGGGLAEGWGPAMGTVPARQPGEHELRELVSQEEGMRRTLLGGILMASRTRLGRHPPGVGDTPGLGDPGSAGTTEPWLGASAGLAPDEPFPPPLYPIQISNPPTAACVCWGGGGGNDDRIGGTAAVPPPPTCVPCPAVPSLGLGPCLVGILAPLRCHRAAPGSTWATSDIMGGEGQQLLLLG